LSQSSLIFQSLSILPSVRKARKDRKEGRRKKGIEGRKEYKK